jgi:hypothetical protein
MGVNLQCRAYRNDERSRWELCSRPRSDAVVLPGSDGMERLGQLAQNALQKCCRWNMQVQASAKLAIGRGAFRLSAQASVAQRDQANSQND